MSKRFQIANIVTKEVQAVNLKHKNAYVLCSRFLLNEKIIDALTTGRKWVAMEDDGFVL